MLNTDTEVSIDKRGTLSVKEELKDKVSNKSSKWVYSSFVHVMHYCVWDPCIGCLISVLDLNIYLGSLYLCILMVGIYMWFGGFNICCRSKCAFIDLKQFSRFMKDMKMLLLEKVFVVNVLGIIFLPALPLTV